MPTALHQEAPSKEYRYAKGWRIFSYILAAPMIAAFLCSPALIWLENDEEKLPLAFVLVVSAVCLGLAAFFSYCVFEAARWRLIVTEDKLISVGTLKTKALAFADIRGFRIEHNHYVLVVPRQAGQPKIKIGTSTESFAELLHWLAERFPNLDMLEQQEALGILLDDAGLGSNETERANQLLSARKASVTLNILGFVCMIWLSFRPVPYQWAIAVGLAVPVLCLIALWVYPKTLSILENKNSGCPVAWPALLQPSLGLMARSAFDHALLDYTSVWPAFITVSVGLLLLLMIGNRHFLLRGTARLTTAVSIVLFAALYGYSATTAYNFAFDTAQPTTYDVQVVSKHIGGGNKPTYHLTLEAWGPRAESHNVTVSADYYEQVEPGQRIRMMLWPGKLNIPWYTIAE
ncbi:hypothetical protein [Hymenobacter latericus]|uniref:hypothetical protein n=1 Tax=Hymenobacter sp. YIM 151858-1 TaxID=2987688 RepID=UPI002225CB03|nr:hypothetical protein [Hymenobacter sp. YIM 151858-1]UYZ58869.1 hypothetical protein OIS50_17630 [Hymenobacter sp. YIM 151858-1]